MNCIIVSTGKWNEQLLKVDQIAGYMKEWEWRTEERHYDKTCEVIKDGQSYGSTRFRD